MDSKESSGLPGPMAGVQRAKVGHTPGPWVVERRDLSSLIWGSAANGHLAVVHQYSGAMNPNAAEAAANARLIAAAPDLLAALQEAIDLIVQVTNSRWSEWEATEEETVGSFRAAVTKATGEAT